MAMNEMIVYERVRKEEAEEKCLEGKMRLRVEEVKRGGGKRRKRRRK